MPPCVAAGLWLSSPRRIGRYSALPREAEAERGRGRRSWPRRAWIARKGLADGIGSLHYVRFFLGRPRQYPAGTFGFGVYWAGHLVMASAALRAFDVRIGSPTSCSRSRPAT